MVVGGFYRLRSHPESLLSAHYGGEKVNGLVPPLNAVEAISYILQQIKCVRFAHAEYRTSHIYQTLCEITPVKKGYYMRDQIECIQNLVLHMQAELDEINERCKIALNTKEAGANVAQQAQPESVTLRRCCDCGVTCDQRSTETCYYKFEA